MASRGLKLSLWWKVSGWLNDEKKWPVTEAVVLCTTSNINLSWNVIQDLIERSSNYRKLVRIVAYLKRFVQNMKREKLPVGLQ